MHEKAIDFLMPTGPSASATPANSTIFNTVLAAATSTAKDLSVAAYAGLQTAINNGCYITLTASVDIWYRWASATGTVDETATAASSPGNQGVLLPAGASVTRMAPQGTTFLLAKATPNAGTLVAEISSRSAPSRIFGGATAT